MLFDLRLKKRPPKPIPPEPPVARVTMACARAATGHVGYGVLLYTGSSDAEGTLGGLIQVGRRIHNSVRSALELGLLCSNDPVCAQHDPENRQEHRHLHGAACHGCVLTAETSCEQQNDFLDRALVVKTVEELGAELFSDAGW